MQRCKYAKERLSIVLCCSAPGEKLKPLVIGNAARPCAFKQNSITPDKLPVTWKHNKKVWMTTAVFEDCLNQLNETMKKKRRIILYVDNATSHVFSKKQSNVRFKFLPPHLTSEFQPLDRNNSSNEGQLQKVYATQPAGCRREVYHCV